MAKCRLVVTKSPSFKGQQWSVGQMPAPVLIRYFQMDWFKVPFPGELAL